MIQTRGLRDLLSVAHPPSATVRLLLMLKAYCDESQDETKARVHVIAGFLATAEGWDGFWQAWNAALVEEGLAAFHMVDCVHGREAFVGMSSARREALQRRFIAIVNTPAFGLVGGVAGVDLTAYAKYRDEFKAARTLPAGLSVSGSLDDPYYLAFQQITETFAIDPFVEALPETEQIAYVFDGTHLSGRVPALFGSIVEKSDFPFRSRMGSVTFGISHKIDPLQAADILAYEARRFLQNRPAKARWQHTAICERVPVANMRLFDDGALRKVLQTFGQRLPSSADRMS